MKASESGAPDGSGSDGSSLTVRTLFPFWLSADAEAFA